MGTPNFTIKGDADRYYVIDAPINNANLHPDMTRKELEKALKKYGMVDHEEILESWNKMNREERLNLIEEIIRNENEVFWDDVVPYILENISREIEEKVKKLDRRKYPKLPRYFSGLDIKYTDYTYKNKWYDLDRNYPSKLIGRIRIDSTLDTKDEYIEHSTYVDLFITSGYYQGATLDFAIDFFDEYQGDYPFDDFIKDWKLEMLNSIKKEKGKVTDQDEERIEKNAERIRNYWNGIVSRIVKDIIKVYEKHTQSLCVVARFSNGETFYAPCKEEKKRKKKSPKP